MTEDAMFDADLRLSRLEQRLLMLGPVLLILLGQDASNPIGHALVAGLSAPLLMIVLCVAGLSVDNVWIASTIPLS